MDPVTSGGVGTFLSPLQNLPSDEGVSVEAESSASSDRSPKAVQQTAVRVETGIRQRFAFSQYMKKTGSSRPKGTLVNPFYRQSVEGMTPRSTAKIIAAATFTIFPSEEGTIVRVEDPEGTQQKTATKEEMIQNASEGFVESLSRKPFLNENNAYRLTKGLFSKLTQPESPPQPIVIHTHTCPIDRWLIGSSPTLAPHIETSLKTNETDIFVSQEEGTITPTEEQIEDVELTCKIYLKMLHKIGLSEQEIHALIDKILEALKPTPIVPAAIAPQRPRSAKSITVHKHSISTCPLDKIIVWLSRS